MSEAARPAPSDEGHLNREQLMAGMSPGVSVGLERQGSQLPVYKRAPSPEITASPVHLQQIPKVLRGAAASSTPRRTAVKSQGKCSGMHY